MQQQISHDRTPIYYLTNLSLFNPFEINLLCLYKKFIEVLVMQLGQDWRIQSTLFTQEILTIKKALSPDIDLKDFNLFNQFLSSFLNGKANKEFDFSRLNQTEIQDKFLQQVTIYLSEEQIKQSLTFKTLSLGFCITASEVWSKTFVNPPQKQFKFTNNLKAFSKLSFVRSEYSQIQAEWSAFNIIQLDNINLQKLAKCLALKKDLSKAQVYTDLVAYVKQINYKQQRFRVFQLSNQFYLRAFIVWLIFSFKMFFALSFKDYLIFCREFMEGDWQQKFQGPLQKFQQIIEREWNKLLKDYTVALHDDLFVLRKLVQTVREQLQREWENKLLLVNPLQKK